MKYELKIKKEKTEVKSIDLPYFSKDEAHHYKLISETLLMIITNVGTNYYGIEVSPYGTKLVFSDNTVQITEAEFNEQYFKIQSQLNQLL